MTDRRDGDLGSRAVKRHGPQKDPYFMADNNLPDNPGPDVAPPAADYDTQVGEIADLLADPAEEQDLQTDEPDTEAAQDTEDDDPLGLGAEDVGDDTAEGPDESEPEIKGGRFAPDSAKVTLDDGTVTTIAELKRGTLFQRDYTRKTQELSEARKSFEAEREQVSQYAQSLNETRDYLAWYAETHLPKQPTPPDDPNDYVAWHNYRLAQDQWNAHAQAYQAFNAQKQQEDQRRNGETSKQAQERRQKEAEALAKAMPVFRDPAKAKQVWANLVTGAQEYFGISEQEVNALEDHRFIVGLGDAIAYRKLKAKAPQVQQQIAAKPPVKPGKRTNPQDQQQKARQVRSEQLRKSGRMSDAVASLMDMDF